MIKPIEIEKLAKETLAKIRAKKSWEREDTGHELIFIREALLTIQNQAYEEAAEIVKSFTICEFDPRLASMQDQEMQLAYRIAQAIRAKIGEKKA